MQLRCVSACFCADLIYLVFHLWLEWYVLQNLLCLWVRYVTRVPWRYIKVHKGQTFLYYQKLTSFLSSKIIAILSSRAMNCQRSCVKMLIILRTVHWFSIFGGAYAWISPWLPILKLYGRLEIIIFAWFFWKNSLIGLHGSSITEHFQLAYDWRKVFTVGFVPQICVSAFDRHLRGIFRRY